MIVLFLPFRDYSFIVDEDDFALLETLEEKKQEEEKEMDWMWPQYYEREENPLPPLDTTHHWDGHPPPHLLQHELFLLPFLVTGFLFFCLAAVAIFKPPLSLIKLNLILALHGLFIILIQVPNTCKKSKEQILLNISRLSDQWFEMTHDQDTGGEEWDAAVEAQRCYPLHRGHDNVHDDMNMYVIMHDQCLFIAMINSFHT